MTNPFETIEVRLTHIENLLLEIRSQKTEKVDKNPEDEIFTVKQASKFLNLAVPTLYSLVSTRKISSYKRGKILYFKKSELSEWINSGKRASVSELIERAKSRTS